MSLINNSKIRTLLLTMILIVGSVFVFSMAGMAVPSDEVDDAKDNIAGEGTEEDPFQLSDVYELEAMPDLYDDYREEHGEEGQVHFELTEIIDASETHDWDSGSQLYMSTGMDYVVDGQGFMITNYHTSDGQWASVFGAGGDHLGDNGIPSVGEVDIKNLGLVNVDIAHESSGSSTHSVGGVVHGLSSESTIENVYVTGSITSDVNQELYAGGITARSGGEINNVYTDVTMNLEDAEGLSSAGGLVGLNQGELDNSWTISTIKADSDDTVGGVSGANGAWDFEAEQITTGTFDNVYWVGSMTSQTDGLDRVSEHSVSSNRDITNLDASSDLMSLNELDLSSDIWNEVSGDYLDLESAERGTEFNLRTGELLLTADDETVSSLEQENEELRTEIDSIQSEYESDLNEYEQEINDMEEEISVEYEQELEEKSENEDINEFEEQLAALEEDNELDEQRQSELNELRAEINELEEERDTEIDEAQEPTLIESVTQPVTNTVNNFMSDPVEVSTTYNVTSDTAESGDVELQLANSNIIQMYDDSVSDLFQTERAPVQLFVSSDTGDMEFVPVYLGDVPSDETSSTVATFDTDTNSFELEGEFEENDELTITSIPDDLGLFERIDVFGVRGALGL